MAFTAMIGKELLEISHNPSMQAKDKMIIANYVPTTVDEESDYEDNETNSTSPTAAGSSATGTNFDDDEDNFEDAVDEDEKEGVAEMKTARPSMGGMLDDDSDVPFLAPIRNVAALNGGRKQYGNDDGSDTKSEENLGYMTPEEGRPRNSNKNVARIDSSQPRQRFRDSLSAAQIEEAKAKGRAQLGLAFEMLTMMKKRALKADPELYQCLIDACGRVGDTKRATDLLAKMHEDGIVADGTVYACLVSAFSAESAWKQGNKEDEELPGERL
jgi:pentatricopeptide repeat protein